MQKYSLVWKEEKSKMNKIMYMYYPFWQAVTGFDQC